VPLEALADRAERALGHDKTVGSAWGGAGSFRELLSRALPKDIKLTAEPPYFAYEPTRQIARDIEARPEAPAPRERRLEAPEPRYEPRFEAPLPPARVESRPEPRQEIRPEPRQDTPRLDARFDQPLVERPQQPDRDPRAAERAAPRYDDPRYAPRQERAEPAPRVESRAPLHTPAEPPVAYGQSGFFAPPPDRAPIGMPAPRSQDAYGAPPPQEPEARQQRSAPAPLARGADQASQIQQSIARIHDACQAPPLSPPEYRVLFEVMAEEITTNNLSGQQTLVNIVERARDMGLEVRRDDVRFVLEVVSEADPWFEQGASANLFASRFRNFVVARCRQQGLNLSADEIDLIDAWFGGAPASQRAAAPQAQAPVRAPLPQDYAPAPQQADRWSPPDPRQHPQAGASDDEFPRIVRSRLRG
jgi:hypothetical protein